MAAPTDLDLSARPPDAPAEDWSVVEHGRSRHDPYHWLQNRDDPRVRPWIVANNEHARAVLLPARSLRDALLAELRALTPPDEGQAAWEYHGWWYRTRFPADDDYPVFVRRAAPLSGPETVLIDGNALARGHSFFAMEGVQLSRDASHLVVAVDTTGSRLYTLLVKDLAANAWLPDRLVGVEPLAAWAADGRSLYYVRPDPVTLRPCRVCRHMLGSDPQGDAVVYEERDPAFRCYIAGTRSWRYIFIHSYASDAEDIRAVDLRRLDRPPAVLCPRRTGHEYEADHYADRFVIRTNWRAPNFRVCESALGQTDPDTWQEVVPHDETTLVERVMVFPRHLAIVECAAARQRVRIVERSTGAAHAIEFSDPAYHVWFDSNPNIETDVLRLGYTSLVTPVTYYDYAMAERALTCVGRETHPGYDPAAFATEQTSLRGADGAAIPVLLAYRRDTRTRGPAPLLLFGYGAYGTNMPAFFDQGRLPLLERGFVYAMARVRGSSACGTAWHRAGRLLHKGNSRADFIAAAEQLVAAGIARRDALFAETLSAGGLTLGGAINVRPDLFRGVVAREPFVDPLNTMTDASVPLVSGEYGEWGDPRIPEQWECMRAYSPYENVRPQAYPSVLATAGLHDYQVQYWEPAKWVARLRAANTAPTQQLLVTDLDAGHGGASGRRAKLRQQAFVLSFLLGLSGAGGD